MKGTKPIKKVELSTYLLFLVKDMQVILINLALLITISSSKWDRNRCSIPLASFFQIEWNQTLFPLGSCINPLLKTALKLA